MYANFLSHWEQLNVFILVHYVALTCLLMPTTVQKLDVPGPDEKFCLCWLCASTKFSSGGAIFPVHLIFEHL